MNNIVVKSILTASLHCSNMKSSMQWNIIEYTYFVVVFTNENLRQVFKKIF